jgi:pectin methylesterase-like acyl-CoA thioesterase
MRTRSPITVTGRALPLLVVATWSLACVAAPACPGDAAWCDDLEQGAARWRLEDGTPAPLRTDAGNRVLLVRPGAASLLASAAGVATPASAAYLEARVRAAAGAGADAAAGTPHRGILAVRYLDAGNWVGAAINLVPGSPRMSVDLVQMRGGRLARLRSLGHDAAPAGSFQTLRVALAGAELAAWLDGERVAATLPDAFPTPTSAPAPGMALLARDGAVEVDDLRLGAAGADASPGRVALARSPARVQLQAGDVQRYPVSAFAGDAVTPLAVAATSSDPSVADAAIDGPDLVVTARRAGKATIRIAGTADGNVATAIAASVGPAFAARGAGLPPRLLPAAGAVDVPVDTLLRIRFDGVPVLGADASIRIHRVRDRALVDTIRLGDEVDAIGHAGQEFKRAVRFESVRVDGNEAVIRLHSARLEYDTDYLVTVDAAAFTATVGGKAFPGVSEAAGWRFRTRARAPGGRVLSVDDDGPADFRTVQGALNHAMAAIPRLDPVTIRIANGRYEELLYLRGKDNVTLRGESRDGVVIAARNDDGTNPGSGSGQAATSPAATGGRAVFLVEDADLLTLERFTLVNTTLRARSLGAQAEALHFNSERRLVARDASFLSEQDTIQVKGYAWFYRTLVAGNVDFIWGANRAALFEDSEIRSVGDSARADGGGYVVQARTVGADDAGFVFLNSRLTHGPGPAGNDVPAGSIRLARPGTAAAWDKVVYVNCRIGDHIAPGGWSLPQTLPPGSRIGSGWMEAGSMAPDGRPLDLSARRGGRILAPEEAARYASRARIFARFDDGKGWDPSPAQGR